MDIPFTQNRAYGDWQLPMGRVVRRFVVKDGEEEVAIIQLITYSLGKGKKFCYAPYGPVVKEYSKELIEFIMDALYDVGKEEGAIFIRLDFYPKIPKDLVKLSTIYAGKKTIHSSQFQPRTEWVLKLSNEDSMLAELDKGTRYSIRKSERDGIEVEIADKKLTKYLPDFYRLMQETAERGEFSLHPKEYYRAVFESLENGSGYLVVAKFGREVVVINLIVVSGNSANYVFSCSSSKYRDKMPAYLAQWKGITHASKMGLELYNFGGISSKEHPQPSWEGLTRFKKKFRGLELEHSELIDLVIEPIWYKAYCATKVTRVLLKSAKQRATTKSTAS